MFIKELSIKKYFLCKFENTYVNITKPLIAFKAHALLFGGMKLAKLKHRPLLQLKDLEFFGLFECNRLCCKE